MAYIGKQPIVGNFVKLDAITTSATTTFNLTNGGVAYFPQTANNCLVSLNGILQAPTDSYTISGSTIIFSSALTTSDVIDFIIVLGDVLNIGTPSDNTVSLAKLTASGTKDATTFLRGDNTFSVPAGGVNTPAFSAKRTGNQSITDSTWTKIQFQTENFDTNSCYDNSTNYRFTPTTAGKYYVFASIGSSASTTYGNAIRVAIYKNGTQYRQNSVATWQNTTETYSTPFVGSIIDFNGSSDYVEAYGVYESSSGPSFVGDEHSEFGAYKLIGV